MGAIKPSLHKFMFPSVRMIMHVGFYLHLHLYFEIDFCLGYFTRDRTDFMNLSQVWTLETQQFEMVIQDCPMSMSFRYKFCGERQFSCTVSSSADPSSNSLNLARVLPGDLFQGLSLDLMLGNGNFCLIIQTYFSCFVIFRFLQWLNILGFLLCITLHVA